MKSRKLDRIIELLEEAVVLLRTTQESIPEAKAVVINHANAMSQIVDQVLTRLDIPGPVKPTEAPATNSEQPDNAAAEEVGKDAGQEGSA